MKRAYSWLEIRAVDEDKRILEGIATTPDVALDGDVLETRGIEFNLPIPFLFRHNSEFPLGNVVSADVSDAGIRVRIQMAEAGIAEYIDEKWRLIKSGTVRGLSLGWKTIAAKFDPKIGGMRISKSRWLELSAVPVGADLNAKIVSVREADEEILAALGNTGISAKGARINPAGASVQPKGKQMKTLQEQIAAAEATRAANIARMKELTDAAAEEGQTMDAAQEQEYDALEADVRKLDKHLVRLRSQAELSNATMTPVQGTNGQQASESRAGSSAVIVRAPQVPKGTGFTRYAIALYKAGGNRQAAADIARSNKVWMDQTPDVELALRAPVTAGTTTDSTWAAPLAPLTNLTSEFVELLRPMTIIGRVPGFRRVPFMVEIPRQTAGTDGSWVGEGARKPVGTLAFDTITLRQTKLAKIVVITEDLARFSNPAAEGVIRQDLLEGIQEKLDTDFTNPAVTASAGVRPASIFNGADTAAAGGTAIADVIADFKDALATFTTAGIPVARVHILTTEDLAVALSLMRTTLDAPAFPGITPTGGTILGFNVTTSSAVPSGHVEFFAPSEVLLADDGGADISISNQASVFMDDGGSPSSTTVTSLWQENKMGIRAERFVNWAKRRDDSTYYITSANYGG